MNAALRGNVQMRVFRMQPRFSLAPESGFAEDAPGFISMSFTRQRARPPYFFASARGDFETYT